MKQFLTGNILLVLCCIFYLAWWMIAFKPVGAVKGMRSGWLLIPAALFGVAAVAMICKGVSSTANDQMLFPTVSVVMIGVVLYVALLAGTWLLLRRPVTTELFLIVGWAVLTAAEISALYGQGIFGQAGAVAWIICIVALALISLICYLLYYNLDSVKGYYDGMLPLIIVAAAMAALSLVVFSRGR